MPPGRESVPFHSVFPHRFLPTARHHFKYGALSCDATNGGLRASGSVLPESTSSHYRRGSSHDMSQLLESIILQILDDKQICKLTQAFQLHYPVADPTRSNQSYGSPCLSCQGRQVRTVLVEKYRPP